MHLSCYDTSTSMDPSNLTVELNSVSNIPVVK